MKNKNFQKRYRWKDVVRATKLNDWIIAYYFNRRISRRITYYLANHSNITPNQVTLLAFCIHLIASIFFLFGDSLLRIIGGVLVEIGFTLDCVDGELARLKNMETRIGMFLDSFLDRFAVNIAITSLSIGSFLRTGETLFLILNILAIMIFYLNEIVFYLCEKQNLEKRKLFKKEINFFSKILFKFNLKPKFTIGYGGDLIWLIITLGAITNFVKVMLLFFIFSQGLILFFSVKKIIKLNNCLRRYL